MGKGESTTELEFSRQKSMSEVEEDEVFSEMADDEKEEEVIPPRGVDWEVVSLTASAYAAAPYPKDFDPNDEVGSKQESSSPMFMSGHFVFPPSEHENLPIEPEIQNISEGDTVISAEEEGEDDKQNMLDDDSQGPKHFDDGTAVSARSLEFEEVKELLSMETANPGDSPNQDLNSPRKFEKTCHFGEAVAPR
ncbi:uncharacterized protein A4U43_C01F29660 [Asparagus officinalis]|uniref:Uncharacterized protein n=1 Tax=Asparagus officinalis TaxID=4686 RepID=A0A5P1FTD7_ASPOF|nr:uncharacterized protein A4U43_C01F29660 [Asparagus officinalis]